MSDKEGEDIFPKGNEWEVLALTESEYAAAPGPKKETADSSYGAFIEDDNSETTGAMFMSSHFGFVPNTPENLPVDNDVKMNNDEVVSESKPYEGQHDVKSHQKDEEKIIEGLISDEFHGSSLKMTEESNMLSLYSSNFGGVDSPKLIDKGMHSKYEETDTNIVLSEASVVSEPLESPEQALSPKHIDGDKVNEIPTESWWRRQAVSFYELVKTADPFWSAVMAVTAVGLVIIGHRWCQEKAEILHAKARILTNEKGPSWMLRTMSQQKEVSWGNQHQHIPNFKFAEL